MIYLNDDFLPSPLPLDEFADREPVQTGFQEFSTVTSDLKYPKLIRIFEFSSFYNRFDEFSKCETG